MMNQIGIEDEIEPSNGLNIEDGLSSNESRDEGSVAERLQSMIDQ